MINEITRKDQRRINNMALNIAVVYVLVGGLWVLFSDGFLKIVIKDITVLTSLQLFKGWFFVLVTGWMLYLLIRRNMTLLHCSEKALLETEDKYKVLFEQAYDAILLLQEDIIIECNDKTLDLFKCQSNALVGKSIIDFSPEKQADGKYSREYALEVIHRTKLGEVQTFEWLHQRSDGTNFNAMVSFTSIKLQGKVMLQAIVKDISELQMAAEKINRLVNYNSLTDLPNRLLFQDRLALACAHAQRHDHLVAVLFLDLDRFKTINDTLGLATGDQLLQMVSLRLAEIIREDDTLAHLGGDEFAVLLTEVLQPEDAVKMTLKIFDAFKEPFVLNNQKLFICTSIGIAIFPGDGNDVQTLMKNADTALYRAKQKGRNNYQLYDPAMHVGAMDLITMENNLRQALEREEFVVYFQPIINIETGQIVTMEALVRWQHPERGLVPPILFIPLAEETGLIEPIGEWVLRTVCKQLKIWQERGLPPVQAAINLSGRQFLQQDLVQRVSDILKETCLEPHWLELEITESVAMQDAEHTINILSYFKKMGIRISLDDFGTGYSSLSHLKRFPIDKLKIDRSFIHDMIGNSDDMTIVSTMIVLAHSLKLQVVAEGVEKEGQLALLKNWGCDALQGYLFYKPLPIWEIENILENNKVRIS